MKFAASSKFDKDLFFKAILAHNQLHNCIYFDVYRAKLTAS